MFSKRALIEFVATHPDYDSMPDLNQTVADGLARSLKDKTRVPGGSSRESVSEVTMSRPKGSGVQKRRWYKVRDLVPYRIFPGTRTTLLTWIQRGKFPKPIKDSGGTMVWPAEVVEQWDQQFRSQMPP
jgi:hypothetical protein